MTAFPYPPQFLRSYIFGTRDNSIPDIHYKGGVFAAALPFAEGISSKVHRLSNKILFQNNEQLVLKVAKEKGIYDINREVTFLKSLPPSLKHIMASPLTTIQNGFVTYDYGFQIEPFVKFNPEYKLAVSIQTIEGLIELIELGALHLDIKSSNILAKINPDGLKVTYIDFGLALKREQNLSSVYVKELVDVFVRNFINVPYQETIEGFKLLSKEFTESDHEQLFNIVSLMQIFAVGITLFKTITGKDPYQRILAPNQLEVVNPYAFDEEVPSINQSLLDTLLESGCPYNLSHLILKMIQADPNSRATLIDLKQFLNNS